MVRTPISKAHITGTATRNPGRYAGRNAPNLSALGEPPDVLNAAEREAWVLFEAELPWLHRSHRAIVHLACVLRAKIEAGIDGINHLQVYSATLSKLGATPADESRVGWHEDDDEDDWFSERASGGKNS